MIKLKSLLFEEEEKKIHPLVSNWKHKKAQKYASILIEKYVTNHPMKNTHKISSVVNRL